MNPGTTYIKTDKGRAEVTERSGSLNPLQRRVLIMVDGKKTANELGAFVRVGELDGALAYLEHKALIVSTDYVAPLLAPAAPGFAASAATERPRPATSQDEFKQVRREATDYLFERLGKSGAPIYVAIEHCENPNELRKLLRGIEIVVGQLLDAKAAQEFARHFGTLLL
jgi:hypothetical protein